MKLSRELEQKILSMPGVTVRHAGQVEKPDEPAKLVEPCVVLAGGKLTAFIPVETASEINLMQWKAKNRRGGKAWTYLR